MSHFKIHDDNLIIILPLPPKALSPNASRGQSLAAALRKSRCVKAHRLLAKATMGNALQAHFPNGLAAAGYRLAFFFRTAAFRDDDNADASCKSYRDGIAQALGVDDRHFKKQALSTHAKDAANPRVEITILLEGGGK